MRHKGTKKKEEVHPSSFSSEVLSNKTVDAAPPP